MHDEDDFSLDSFDTFDDEEDTQSPYDEESTHEEYDVSDSPDIHALDQSGYDYGESVSQEDLDAIEAQLEANRQQKGSVFATPTDIGMVNEHPGNITQSYSTKPQDSKLIRNVVYACIALVVALVIMLFMVIVRPLLSSDTEENTAASPTTVGSGDIISERETQKSSSKTDSEGTDSENGTAKDDKVSIPAGGHKIVYSLKYEGDITGASTTFINGRGASVQEVGISLPWKKTIGAKQTVTPRFKTATKGNGTVTCEITQDGKKIAEKTIAGDSPIVECSA